MHWWRVKQVVNVLNLSTPTGLLVAATGRCRVTNGPQGLFVATGYRLPLPANPAFTIGNVVLTRREPGFLESHPRLLAHEERHTWQYVACLGLPMLPLYLVAAGWSYLRCGDPGVRNVFERLAGLADGGYRDPVEPHSSGAEAVRPSSAPRRA